MAQSGYTPIQLYYSTTAAAVPVNTNLANGELAINITDGKLYYKDNGGTVRLLASNATSAPVLSFSAGTTGFTPSSATAGAVTLAGTLATTNGGTGLTSFTANGVVFASSTGVLETRSSLAFDGLNFNVGGTYAVSQTNVIEVNNRQTGATKSATGISLISDSGGIYTSAFYVVAGSNTRYNLMTGSPTTALFYTNNTEGMRLTSTGLGIGTSSPTSKFVVSNSGAAGFEVDPTGVASNPLLISYNRSGAAYTQLTASALRHVWQLSGSETMRIESTGNVGIGSTSPQAKLVVSNGGANGYEFDPNNAFITSYNRSTSAFTAVKFRALSYIFNLNNTTDALSLDSAGNLGLGVTPNTWYLNAGVYKAFQFGSGSLFFGNTTSSAANISLYANAYLDTSAVNRYLYSNYATKYEQSSGYHAWHTAASGTAGASFTFTQAMTLDASGRLLLGTTTQAGMLTVSAPASNSYGTFDSVTTGYGYHTYKTGGTTIAYIGQGNGLFSGGTSSEFGITTTTANSLIFGTNTVERFRVGPAGQFGIGGATYGTSGQVLTSGGSGAAPTWTTPASGGSAATPTALGTVYGSMTTAGGTPFLTALGYNAGVNTTGTHNTAVGVSALQTNSSGNYNSALGFNALTANTTANFNTGVGYTALATNSTGAGNTAVGFQSLQANTTSSYNTAVGYQAAYANTTADNLVAIGRESMKANTTGAANVSVGALSLTANTTGNYNTALGAVALGSNTTASNNTAVGYQALQANTTASSNTAVGYQALNANTTAGNNTAIGTTAGLYITTGVSNVCIGSAAGSDSGTTKITTGNYNVVLGSAADISASSGSSQVVIGFDALGKGDSTAFIGGASGAYNGANSATWSVTSDQRLKKNIVDNNIGLEKLTQIQVRNFEYRLPEEVTELSQDQAIKKSSVQLGVIAQELQAVLPDCVKQESTGVLTVNSDNLTWYMINAIKELKAQNDSLKARLDAANL